MDSHKIRWMSDVEYRPQRGVGTRALVSACIALAVAAVLFSLGTQSRADSYVAVFPAVVALVAFTVYAARRRLRCRLTLNGIDSAGKKDSGDDVVVYNVDFDTQKNVVRAMGASMQGTLIVFSGSAEKGRSVSVTDPAAIESLLAKANS